MLAVAFVLLAAQAGSAGAQPVLGLGESALVLPRGVLRITVGAEHDRIEERFGSDAAGVPDGTRVPFRRELAGPFDATAVPLVADVQARLRALTGDPSLTPSLGALDARAEALRFSAPLQLELGIGARLQLSARVPYVRSRVVAFPGAAGEATLGLNPALTDPQLAARTTRLLDQFATASTALETALAQCAADPAASPACADPAAARATDAAAQAFATGLGSLYLPAEDGSGTLVPVDGSAAAAAVAQRIDAFRAAYAALGVDPFEAGLIPAPAGPVTGADLSRLASEDAFGLGYRPLGSRTRYGIGDVELGAKLLLLDGFGREPATAIARRPGLRARASATALLRLGTGSTDDVDDLIDLGVGEGQHDVELGVVGDLMVGRLFVSAAGRYGLQLADEPTLRVPTTPGAVLLPAAARATVERDLGDYVELEVTPRYVFSDYAAVAAQYRYRRRGEDSYVVSGNDAAAAALAFGSEGYEHRAGLGLTISTLASWARGTVGAPLEVSYLHLRTIAGGGVLTNAATTDQVMVRVYLGLFGDR